jgi:hypothetical protein
MLDHVIFAGRWVGEHRVGMYTIILVQKEISARFTSRPVIVRNRTKQYFLVHCKFCSYVCADTVTNVTTDWKNPSPFTNSCHIAGTHSPVCISTISKAWRLLNILIGTISFRKCREKDKRLPLAQGCPTLLCARCLCFEPLDIRKPAMFSHHPA